MSADPFSSIIGHDNVCDVLQRALASGLLPHALLFVGPNGVGRRTVAEALIATFLRRGLAGGIIDTHPDFMRLMRETDEKTGKEKTLIGIEQIGGLRERLHLSSFTGRKAAFIEEADRMSMGATNALLKTLEEPRGDALIILRAPRQESVPATIASRCQIIRFHPVPRAKIIQALIARGMDGQAAQDLARLACGAPGHAFRLLRNLAARTETDVGFSLFLSCMESSLPKRLKTAAALLPKDEANKAMVLARTLEQWEPGFRDMLLHAIGCEELATRADADLRRLASRFSPLHCVKALQAISAIGRDVMSHVNPQMALEHVLLSFP